MKLSFKPNITRAGRIVRGAWAGLMLAASAWSFAHSIWIALVFALAGCVAIFEALRGWCVLRACGIRTRL